MFKPPSERMFNSGEGLESKLRPLPLHKQFAAAGGAVMLVGMLLIGWWLGREIEESVTRNSAISTALYMESFIAPLSQELSNNGGLTPLTAEKAP